MSEDEPYDEEFDSEGEQEHFRPVPEEGSRDREREKAAAAPLIPPEADEEDYNEYADEDFEDKSSEVQPELPKAPVKSEVKPAKAKVKQETEEEEGYESNEEDFFMTGVRPKSKEVSPGRRISGGVELRSNIQSSGKLTSVSHFDSPEKAMKYLALLKRENISLRGDLKQINDRLNEILDQKIAESNHYLEPRKVMQPEQREKATTAQLDSALKQLQMIKKEKIRVYKRLQQVEDVEYVEELKTAVEKKERLLKKLQKSQKSSKKTQQTREKDIEKEIVRTELSLNTRVLQELQMENEGLKMKIRDLEREDERNASVATEMESQQEKLEQRYIKLITLAKQNGTFEDNTRENKRLHKMKVHYEEQKIALGSLQSQTETAVKQLKRLENELKTELETLKLAQRSAGDQMREKQSKMSQLLDELQFLRPKVVGSGYESLLDRISTSIKEKEALLDKPITPLRLRSLDAEKEPILRGKSATKTSLEGRKSPNFDHSTEGKPGKVTGKVEESPVFNPKPPISTSKPSLFSAGPSIKEEKELLKAVPPIEDLKEPEIPKKPLLLPSKPSLFSSVKTEENRDFSGKTGKEAVDRAEDVIPTKEIKPVESISSVKPPIPMGSPSMFDPKPTKAMDLPLPIDQPKPTFSSPPNPPTDEIGTLDAFPSRRRGKKASAEPLPAVFPSKDPPIDTDFSVKPRNRSHLLTEEPPMVMETPPSILPKPASIDPPTVLFETPQIPPVTVKQSRNRSHLLEETPPINSFPAVKPAEIDDFKLGKRDRSHLKEEKPVGKQEFASLQGQIGGLERKKEDKTAELAKKAEKGGFFGEIEEESLDFSDLSKVVTKIQPIGGGNKGEGVAPVRENTPPVVKKTEAPKPQILDLEESDIML